MSAALADFLDWDERQERRYEFDGFQPIAMTGGTLGHEIICGTPRTLTEGDVLQLPEIDIALGLREIHADVDFSAGEDATAASSAT